MRWVRIHTQPAVVRSIFVGVLDWTISMEIWRLQRISLCGDLKAKIISHCWRERVFCNQSCHVQKWTPCGWWLHQPSGTSLSHAKLLRVPSSHPWYQNVDWPQTGSSASTHDMLLHKRSFPRRSRQRARSKSILPISIPSVENRDQGLTAVNPIPWM